MSLIPHPRIHLRIDAASAAPLTLVVVIAAMLLLAVVVALIQALG